MQTRLVIKGLDTFTKGAKAVIVKATYQTVNDMTKQTKTAVSKEVRTIYNVKAKRINKATKIKRATKRKAEAEIRYRGKPPGLQNYGAKQTVRKGVTVKVLKAGGRKTVKGGFMHPDKLVGVFKRVRREAYPIKRLVGPSVPQMVTKKRIIKKAIMIRKTKGQKIFDNKVKFLAEKELAKRG